MSGNYDHTTPKVYWTQKARTSESFAIQIAPDYIFDINKVIDMIVQTMTAAFIQPSRNPKQQRYTHRRPEVSSSL